MWACYLIKILIFKIQVSLHFCTILYKNSTLSHVQKMLDSIHSFTPSSLGQSQSLWYLNHFCERFLFWIISPLSTAIKLIFNKNFLQKPLRLYIIPMYLGISNFILFFLFYYYTLLFLLCFFYYHLSPHILFHLHSPSSPLQSPHCCLCP